jgi:hypothetical protein
LQRAVASNAIGGGDARLVEPARRQSDPCDAYAPHGYFGIETQAVDTIARFINAKGAHEPQMLSASGVTSSGECPVGVKNSPATPPRAGQVGAMKRHWDHETRTAKAPVLEADDGLAAEAAVVKFSSICPAPLVNIGIFGSGGGRLSNEAADAPHRRPWIGPSQLSA